MNSNCTEDLLLLQCACSISIFWDKDYLIPLRSKIPQNPHQSALYIQWHHLPLQKQPMSQTQWESAFIIFLEAVSVFWDLAEPSEKNKLHFQLWRLVAMEKVDVRDWSPKHNRHSSHPLTFAFPVELLSSYPFPLSISAKDFSYLSKEALTNLLKHAAAACRSCPWIQQPKLSPTIPLAHSPCN